MKKSTLLLGMFVLAGFARGQPAPAIHSGETSRLVMATEPAFAPLRERYPELAGAYLVSTSRGIIRQAEFREADAGDLRRLAESLLDEALVVPASTWVEDRIHARLLTTPQSDTVTVLQHRVDGVDVEGSFVVVRMNDDGSGEVASSLIPVQPPKKALLAPRNALQKAVGTTSPVESMSGDVSVEPTYIRSPEGIARLAYRAETSDASGERWILHVDAENGRLLTRMSSRMPLDSAPDDIYWTSPPWTWFGTTSAGDPTSCMAELADTTATAYYPPGNKLPGIRAQVNAGGPGVRLRNSALGLTSMQWWGQTMKDLESVWQTWTWADVAARIPQKAGFSKCVGNYPPPAGYPGDVPYTTAEVDQHHYLQVAMQDLDERFGWHGLNNQYNPLLLVQNVDPLATCYTHLPSGINNLFAAVSCGLDYNAVANGMPQRVPPIEVFAHEFSHTIIADLGFSMLLDFEQKAMAEALADIFGVAVKAGHGGDPWMLGDRAEWIQRYNESLCEAAGGAGSYCDIPALVAVRDAAHPKTMNPIDPGVEFYEGDNWLALHSLSGKWNYHGASQVVSHMLYMIAEGALPGARDDKPVNGTYEAFAGIGLQETLDIFGASLGSLQQINYALFPMEEYATQYRIAAIQQCGQWSEADLVAGKAAWIANLGTDVDLQDADYHEPDWGEQDVVPLAQFEFEGEASQSYEFQVSTDFYFTQVIHHDTVDTNKSGQARFLLKLAPDQSYWWRVRLANAPMLSSRWVLKDEACWRPASPFHTGGPAEVTDPTPAGDTAATGDEVEPWNVVFRWTGHSRFDGYELWVDDEKPEGGKYLRFWAHKLFEGDNLPIDTEHPGTLEEPNFKVPPIPLPSPASGPQSGLLCWKIVPFARDDFGKRVDGDAREECFRTREPQTLITHPAPPSVDGTLSVVPAQPLAIDYDPADGAEQHEFSLEVLTLSGANAPDAEGPWAYVDDVAHDKANRVKEAADPSDWTMRTRLRMLPVQLDSSPYLNYGLGKVRATIESRSPAISSKDNGGTYPEFHETAKAAQVDFHPMDQANFVALHPFITAPPTDETCSSKTSTDLSVEWNHGPDATPDKIQEYKLRLYPQFCGNGSFWGCHAIGDPLDPDFVDTLAFERSVAHNGQPSQRVDFSRGELFIDEDAEMDDTEGFLVHLFGVSGPEPGPAGLNITGNVRVDLPVLPATLSTLATFEDGGAEHPEWSKFTFFALTNKNPNNALRTDQFEAPGHEIKLRIYRGASCDENQVITEATDPFFLELDDAGQPDSSQPQVSVRAIMTADAMLCPTLVSDCVSATGINRQSTPHTPSGLAPRETAGFLGASWDVSGDSEPQTLEYHLGLFAQGNQPENLLANHPAPVTITAATLEAFDGQIGIHALAALDPADAGKNVILRLMVCRAGTDKCSDEIEAPYTVGSGPLQGVMPSSPADVALHLEETGALGDLIGEDLGVEAGWISVSWNPPAGGVAPSHYLVTFSATADVPGVLPNWLNTLGVPGVNYPGDPMQYTSVIRALPQGMTLSGTDWASFVWLLAETHVSVPPAANTWLSAKVWACAGNPPLPPLRDHDWIVGADTQNCSAPAEVSLQYQ